MNCECIFVNILVKNKCFSIDGLTLDEPCDMNGQCTGTPDADNCIADHIDRRRFICQCSTGFLRHNDSCLKGTVPQQHFIHVTCFI